MLSGDPPKVIDEAPLVNPTTAGTLGTKRGGPRRAALRPLAGDMWVAPASGAAP